MMSLNGDKGLGPYQMSVAVLQAGGWVVAEIVHEIVLMIVHARYIPIVWRGGKLVALYKGKGPPSCCDSYLGLLISDHVGKIFTTLLQWHLQSSYETEVGEVQFGAVAGRSTAMASLFLRSFPDCCKLMSWSCFVLFVDLSKAFDYAAREVVMGWIENAPTARADQIAYLKEVGIPDDAADNLAQWLDEYGPLLTQMGHGADVTALVSSSQPNAWFVLPDDERAIVTRTGGR
jgi:hypothetical protein